MVGHSLKAWWLLGSTVVSVPVAPAWLLVMLVMLTVSAWLLEDWLKRR